MIPSKYQQAILDFVCNEQAHAIVEATAGSGKTRTLQEIAARLPQDTRCLYLVFNKRNQIEAQQKMPQFVDVMTFNAFGHRICCKHLGRSQPEIDKVRDIFEAKHGVSKASYEQKKEIRKILPATIRLVSLLRSAGALSVSEAIGIYDDLIGKHDIEIPENDSNFKSQCLEVFEACINEKYVRDFDDQIYMVVKYSLPVPNYDLVMVDESQDMNPIKILLVQMLIDAGARVICVGDRRQAIYGFAGADTESMQHLKDILNAKLLPLSICYRCSKAVVERAKIIAPEIESSPTAPDGLVTDIKEPDFKAQIKAGDYALCRTTAPLVSYCLAFIREGKKAVVLGRDIGKGLQDLLQKLGPTSTRIDPDGLAALNEFAQRERAKLERMRREAALMALDDKIATIKALFEEGETLADTARKIDSIFSDETSSGITFMTMHKAKGLEADNVYILHPELLPHPAASQEWQLEQEKNLEFVAITRARVNSYWVR